MFCTNCGKEVADNAFACPACGCLVKDDQTIRKNQMQLQSEKREKLITIFLFVSFGCFCVSLFFLLISMMSPNVVATYSYSYVTTYVHYDMSTVAPALVMYFPFLGFAITAFVMALHQKENKTLKTLCILNFMLALVFLPITCTLWDLA